MIFTFDVGLSTLCIMVLVTACFPSGLGYAIAKAVKAYNAEMLKP